MRIDLVALTLLLIGSPLAGCSNSSSKPDLCTGSECRPDGASAAPSHDAGAANAEAGPAHGDTGAPPAPLSVTLAVDGLARACGDCAVVTAKPTGGVPPYQLTWSQPQLVGVGPHELCDDRPASYAVTVTDGSGGAQGDVGSAVLPPMEADASVELPCTQQAVDAGSGFTGCKLLLNASILSLLDPSQAQPDNIFGCERLDGGAGIALQSADAATQIAAEYAQLPEPMRARESYSLAFELVLPFQLGGAARAALWGSRDGCSLDEKLGELSVIDGMAAKVCMTPSQAFSKLLLVPIVDESTPIFAFSLGESVTLCATCAGP